MKTQTTIKTGDLVVTWTGLVGQVRYETADGWYGLALVNEQGRMDEWQAWQLTAVTPEQAARLVTR